jgi:hypothetical protein
MPTYAKRDAASYKKNHFKIYPRAKEAMAARGSAHGRLFLIGCDGKGLFASCRTDRPWEECTPPPLEPSIFAMDGSKVIAAGFKKFQCQIMVPWLKQAYLVLNFVVHLYSVKLQRPELLKFIGRDMASY